MLLDRLLRNSPLTSSALQATFVCCRISASPADRHTKVLARDNVLRPPILIGSSNSEAVAMALCTQHSLPFHGSGSNAIAHKEQPAAQCAISPPQRWTPSPLKLAATSEKQGPVVQPLRSRQFRASAAGGLAVTDREAVEEDSAEVEGEDPAKWSRLQREAVERTLDLEGLNPSPARRAELVQQALAGAETGFFYVKNFGVEQALLDGVRAEAFRFFSQPMEEKVKTRTLLKVPDGRTYGYGVDLGGVASNTEDGGLPEPKIREVYRLRVHPESHRVEKAWPPALPSFRDKFSLYADRILAAAHFVGGLLSEGLGLPESYITDTYGPLLLNMVMARRLARPPGSGSGKGLPTHTDSNLFNFHVADGVRGLEIFQDGVWFTAPPLLDRALFTVGEDMETLSNGRCFAVYHRVAPGRRLRQSMITTCDLGRDEIIGPAPQLVDEHNPARYLVRRQADRTDHLLTAFARGVKPDRTKAPLLVHPDQHLDHSRNLYYHGEEELLYINGEPLEY